MYFSLIDSHAGICSWNQPVLSNEGCFLFKFELTTDSLQIRRATHCHPCKLLLYETPFY